MSALATETGLELAATWPRWRSRLRFDEESSIIAEAQRGSADAIEHIVRYHWPRAHRTAYLIVHDGSVAEDIAQESMMAALGALDRFDRRRRFAPWLHRIVVNNALGWARSRSRRPELSSEHVRFEQVAVEREPDVSTHLLETLRALEPDQRAVVVLRHLLGYSPREIGRMLDLPTGTVNSRLRRALDRMGELLGEEMS